MNQHNREVHMSLVKAANKTFLHKDYISALKLYQDAALIYGSELFQANIHLCERYLGYSAQPNPQVIKHPATVPQPRLSIRDLRRWLWSGFSGVAEPLLAAALNSSDYSASELKAAAYELARWYIHVGESQKAKSALTQIRSHDIQFYRSKKCKLLMIENLIQLQEFDKAKEIIDYALSKNFDGDFVCAHANMLRAKDGIEADAARIETINSIFTANNLLPMTLEDESLGARFGNWRNTSPSTPVFDGPKVSVLMPVYKASDFITTSVESLLAQTWQNLEIIAVDDCSPDDTWHILQALAARDSRLRIFQNQVNLGAYPNRNRALKHATGDYITVHDSDDWSHPQMIELQMRALEQQPDLKATCSMMVRVHPDLRFILRPQRENLEYIHRSYPSLLMRRHDLAKLGEWDGVTANADDELVQRARLLWGEKTIIDILPNVPLSFFLVHENSLTQQKGTSLNSLSFGIRQEYARQAAYWRRRQAKSGASMAYKRTSIKDPFPIPSGLAPKNWPRNTAYDIILISDLSLLGGTRRCNEGYIEAASQMGLRIGLFHWPRFDLKPVDIAADYLELSYRANVDILVPEDEVQARLVLIHHPPILNHRIDAVPRIRAERLAILVNQSPMQCWSEEPHYYDGQHVEQTCREIFGLSPCWIPISPRVRRIFDLVGGFERIHSEIWYPPYRDFLPSDPPQPPRGLGKRRNIVLGRHARDHWTKWPATPEKIKIAYCADLADMSVQLLGGSRTADKLLGSRPKNWVVKEFDSLPVADFLRDIDFFIHYVHEDYIEEFGRNVMEAMAAGRVVILPPDFQEIFGDAALYCEPEEVAVSMRYVWNNPIIYQETTYRGFEFVKSHCSAAIIKNNLRSLL